MKYILSILLLLSLTACTVTAPHVSEYRVAAQKSEVALDSKACRDKTVKVSQAFSANSLMSEKMKYAQNEYREYSFSESKWSRSPNKAITDEITKSVRASKLFQTVQGYKSRSRSDYLLESSIDEFIQYFGSDSKSSYASVVITLSLVDAKSLKTLSSRQLSAKVDVQELSAAGGVKALNKALSELLLQNNLWLNEVCR